MSTCSQPLIEIRTATRQDAPFILQSNLAMAAETEDTGLDPQTLERGIEYLLQHPAEGQYLVATLDGSAAGTLMTTYEWSDWRNGRFWWIQSVYVMPEHRRRGVYRAMHEAVRARAGADPQACGIRLYVEQDNRNAQSTYTDIDMRQTHYRLYEEALKPRD